MVTRKSLIRVLALLAVATGTCWAAVPQSLSYQGYLADSVGSPIDRFILMTFAVYNADIGGSPLWTQTEVVTVDYGIFSVQLGGPASPFPDGLFNAPLWLGITVEPDTEMLPRRPLTSASFSFRAEDADGLQGRSAAELDQSDHVSDGSNPHAVTAGQAGAATQVGLDAHAGDSGNPHGVSVGQTGGTAAATFSAHAADSTSHHARYADGEAVAAMGVQDSSNPLNHSRYTNTETVAAVLAADGDGSGFDSDLVDGLQATEIINAAAGAVGGTRYEFVGFSTDTVAADSGLLGMTNACKAKFGSTAKFATSKEVIETTSFSLQLETAFVQPVIVGAIPVSTTTNFIIVDVSGIVVGSGGNGGSLNCNAWTTTLSGDGIASLVVTDTIGIDRSNCSTAKRVACSMPANGTTR